MKSFALRSFTVLFGLFVTFFIKGTVVALCATTVLVMGGSRLEIQPWSDNPNQVHAPATLGLISGFGAPTMNEALEIADLMLNSRIHETLDGQQGQVVVEGTSHGAISIALWKQRHANGADPNAPDASSLSFVSFADPARPGGLFTRFVGLHIPIIGVTFIPAAPDTQYQSVSIAKQYDGFPDFPTYPLNILADINALLGIGLLHFDYSDVANVTVDTPGVIVKHVGNTTYITVPTAHLPLLMPAYAIAKAIGRNNTPLLDAIEPVLRVLVDAGYDRNEDMGAPTPARLLPPVSELKKLVPNVTEALKQGASTLQSSVRLPSLPQPPAEVTKLTQKIAATVENQRSIIESKLRPRGVSKDNKKDAVQHEQDSKVDDKLDGDKPDDKKLPKRLQSVATANGERGYSPRRSDDDKKTNVVHLPRHSRTDRPSHTAAHDEDSQSSKPAA